MAIFTQMGNSSETTDLCSSVWYILGFGDHLLAFGGKAWAGATFVSHEQGKGASSGSVRKVEGHRALAEDHHHLREGRGRGTP